MDLYKFLKYVKKDKNLLIGTILAFTLAGILTFYLIPVKYVSSGSLFISRNTNPQQPDHFTYEGYYSQQAALSYTNSIMGLMESEDILAETLQNMQMEVTEENLRKLSRRVATKKSGPQLIELSIKAPSPEEAERIWVLHSGNTIETIEKIKSNGDPQLNINKIRQNPVTKTTYKNLAVNIIVGIIIGTTFGLSLVLAKFYLRKFK